MRMRWLLNFPLSGQGRAPRVWLRQAEAQVALVTTDETKFYYVASAYRLVRLTITDTNIELFMPVIIFHRTITYSQLLYLSKMDSSSWVIDFPDQDPQIRCRKSFHVFYF